MSSADPLHSLIAQWREDPGGTYRSWFLREERLKNFRSIRSGRQAVIAEIAEGASATSTKDPHWRPWSAQSQSSKLEAL